MDKKIIITGDANVGIVSTPTEKTLEKETANDYGTAAPDENQLEEVQVDDTRSIFEDEPSDLTNEEENSIAEEVEDK